LRPHILQVGLGHGTLRFQHAQVLSKFWAFVRQRARTSIRKRKGTSQPGSPPYSHVGLLRKFILFAYEPARQSVVIGPVLLREGSDVLRLPEQGGRRCAAGCTMRAWSGVGRGPCWDRRTRSEAGRQRDADLFLRHLDDLRRRFRRYRRIHVICDNAIFHRPDRCQKVQEYLARWGHRIVLHFLPTYAPETNPIERV